MRVIGLIGGMSWESSAEYYRIINETVKQRLGGYHSAKILMYSVDFAEIEQMQVQNRWDDAGEVLSDAARRLERGGADMIAMCTNTMHKLADCIETAVAIPFLHIADAAAWAVKDSGITKAALLGTRYTMEQDFYKDRLKQNGLDIIVPEKNDRDTVHDIIFGELVHGVITQKSRDAYLEVISRLKDNGAQGVILGCTEIGLLIRQSDCDLTVFDTTRIHAEAAAEMALR